MTIWKLLILTSLLAILAWSVSHADEPRRDSDFDIRRLNWSIPLAQTTSIPSVSCFDASGTRPEVIVLQDGSRVRAINSATGAAAWPVSQDDDGDLLPQAQAGSPICSGEPLTDSTWVGIVSGEMLGTRIDRLQIVCLDLAQEGRLLWKKSAAELMQQQGWSFAGQLMAHSGVAYASMMTNTASGEPSIAALNSQGEVRWISGIAISDAGTRFEPRTPIHMVSSETGDLLVIFTPDQTTVLKSQDGSRREPSLAEISRTSVRAGHAISAIDGLVMNGRFFRVAGHDVDAWSLTDGRHLWTQHLDEPATSLVGANGETLIVSGNSLNGIHLLTGQLQWHFRSAFPAFQGVGRGVLIENRLLWPTQEELWSVAPETGAILSRQPLKALTGFAGGDVTFRHGKLLILNPHRFTSYQLTN